MIYIYISYFPFSYDLMNSCWSFDPTLRPTATSIVEQLTNNQTNYIQTSDLETTPTSPIT